MLLPGIWESDAEKAFFFKFFFFLTNVALWQVAWTIQVICQTDPQFTKGLIKRNVFSPKRWFAPLPLKGKLPKAESKKMWASRLSTGEYHYPPKAHTPADKVPGDTFHEGQSVRYWSPRRTRTVVSRWLTCQWKPRALPHAQPSSLVLRAGFLVSAWTQHLCGFESPNVLPHLVTPFHFKTPSEQSGKTGLHNGWQEEVRVTLEERDQRTVCALEKGPETKSNKDAVTGLPIWPTSPWGHTDGGQGVTCTQIPAQIE